MADADALLTRLNRLEASEAARAVTWRYAAGLDSGDLGAVVAAFTADAELRARGAVFRGVAEIADYFRKALAGPHQTAHFMANQQVTVLGDREVEIRSGFLFTAAGPEISIMGWGHHANRVVVEDGVGRFTRKEITVQAMGDVAPGWATS